MNNIIINIEYVLGDIIQKIKIENLDFEQADCILSQVKGFYKEEVIKDIIDG